MPPAFMSSMRASTSQQPRADLVEAGRLDPVLLLRAARHGVEPEVGDLDALEQPHLATGVVLDHPGGPVGELRGQAALEHVGRFDEVVVDADDDEVVGGRQRLLDRWRWPMRRSGGAASVKMRPSPIGSTTASADAPALLEMPRMVARRSGGSEDLDQRTPAERRVGRRASRGPEQVDGARVGIRAVPVGGRQLPVLLPRIPEAPLGSHPTVAAQVGRNRSGSTMRASPVRTMRCRRAPAGCPRPSSVVRSTPTATSPVRRWLGHTEPGPKGRLPVAPARPPIAGTHVDDAEKGDLVAVASQLSRHLVGADATEGVPASQ